MERVTKIQAAKQTINSRAVPEVLFRAAWVTSGRCLQLQDYPLGYMVLLSVCWSIPGAISEDDSAGLAMKNITITNDFYNEEFPYVGIRVLPRPRDGKGTFESHAK
jgi:hypothetical protein